MGPRPGRTKTAVDRVGRGKERQVNARFLAMTNHYVFEPTFCNPASGWEKGQVEKNVQDARPRLWLPPLRIWAELSRSGGAEPLVGTALHGGVARDSAWWFARHAPKFLAPMSGPRNRPH